MLFNVPGTLCDLGFVEHNYQQPKENRVSTATANLLEQWSDSVHQPGVSAPAHTSAATPRANVLPVGPFVEDDMNEVWAARTLHVHEELAATDVLEQDPPNWQAAVPFGSKVKTKK